MCVCGTMWLAIKCLYTHHNMSLQSSDPTIPPGPDPTSPDTPVPPSSNDLGTTRLISEEHITLIIGILPATFVIVVVCILAFLLLRAKKKRGGEGQLLKQASNCTTSSEGGEGEGVDQPDSGEIGGRRGPTHSRRQQRRLQRQDSMALVLADSTELSAPNPCYKRSISCPPGSPVKITRRMERRLQRQVSLMENGVVITESLSTHITRQVSINSLHVQSFRFPGSTQYTIAPTQLPWPSHQLKSVPLVLSPLPELLEHRTPPVTLQESATSSVAITTLHESVAMTPTSSSGAVLPPASLPAVEQMNAEDSS